MQIEKVKELIRSDKVIWTEHARERMEQRQITKKEIITSILEGEIIEDYPDSFPFPSCLLYGMISKEKVIHVVLGFDGKHMRVITVYIPDKKKFEKNLKVRRRI